MIITIGHNIYTLDKDTYESDDIFYKRLWFIISQEPKNEIEFKKFVDYSYIWINIHYHSLTYDKSIMEHIKTYSNNLNITNIYDN